MILHNVPVRRPVKEWSLVAVRMEKQMDTVSVDV